jgi:hypothetical protein
LPSEGATLARDELTSLLQELTSREEAVSDERRVLHTQIDALRKELVDRLRDEGNVVISGSDSIALPEPPAPDTQPEAPPRDPPTH